MTAWTVTPTDSAGLTDAGTALGHTWNVIEAASPTDSATTLRTHVVSVTDSGGLTDVGALGTRIGHSGTIVESPHAGAVDIFTTLKQTVGVTWTVTPTDTAGLTDAGTALGHEATLIEEAGLTDAGAFNTTIIPATSFLLTVADDQGSSDSSLLEHGWSISTLDDGGLTEYPDIGFLDVTQFVDDIAGASDTPKVDRALQPVDAAGATDSVAVVHGFSTAFIDPAGNTDSVTIAMTWGVRPVDSAGSVDSATVVGTPPVGLVIQKSVPDDSGLSDSVATVGTFFVAVTDNQGSSDTALPVATTSTSYSVNVTDPVAALDLFATTGVFARTVADDLGLVDSPSAVTTNTGTHWLVSVVDNAGSADLGVGFVWQYARPIIDAAGASDTASELNATVTFWSVNVTDDGGASDSLASVGAFQLAVDDGVQQTDLIDPDQLLHPVFTDNAGAVDLFLPLITTSEGHIKHRHKPPTTLTAGKGAPTVELRPGALEATTIEEGEEP